MAIKEKAKYFAYGFFDSFEVKSINFAMKIYYKWNLKHYCLDADYISPTFKKEVLSYWRQYTRKIKPHWHKYYSSRNGIYDVRYIPDDIYYTVIDQHFNNRKNSFGVMDKNYFTLWFPEVKQPHVLARKINGNFYDKSYNIITLHKAIELCCMSEKNVIKPSVETGGGKGIKFWNKLDGVKELRSHVLSCGNNYIVQELILQHKELKRIHPSSVNTVRIITLLFNGKVHVLSCVLRMGINGSMVDNATAGGITCGIKEDGKLKNVAYSGNGIKYEKHPQGYNFSECVVPTFKKIINIVKKQQEKMANFRMISWDIAVGEDGDPILIEANLRLGELGFHQLNNGPLFGKLTDQVLGEVFRRKL